MVCKQATIYSSSYSLPEIKATQASLVYLNKQ